MNKVLILFAHPRTDRSEVNIEMAKAARSIDGVTLVDLYERYPSFEIDVELEQQRLVEHDIIILHHPVYWYSCPAILKEWQDLVLEYGFAYGSEGRALEGKTAFNVVTCGARREVYTREGAYRHELRELFAPFEQTFLLCRMQYLGPFAIFAAGHAVEEDRLEGHIAAYKQLLTALVEGRLDIPGAEKAKTLSDNLDTLIKKPAEVK